MLSIGKLVAGAEDYYLSMVAKGREEYYTGAGESPGTWVGRAAARLELSGEVGADNLRAVLAGFSPRTGTELGLPRRSGTRVAGFDLTFSAPKSVSLLYALGSAEQSSATRAAHEAAVGEALDYLERHALFARRGEGGQRRIEVSGLVAGAFVHRTSRNGDPQLHTHVLVANAVEGADGRWSAPDARGFYVHARTAGFVYQAALRAGLVESLGVSFGPVRRGAAELAYVDATLLGHFSSRRAEIEEYLALTGHHSRAGAEVAALATRAPKAHLSPGTGETSDQHAQWRLAVGALGVDPDALFLDLGRPHRVELDRAVVSQISDGLLGPEGLTASDSTFERRDVVLAVAERCPEGAHLDAIESAVEETLGRRDVVALERLGRGAEPQFTTRQLIAIETDLVATAQALHEVRSTALDPFGADRVLEHAPGLSDEQRGMVCSVVSDPRRLDVVVGKAGAGKTTALSVARQILEDAGWQISGTALSARAAAELNTGAGIASVTLTRFFAQLETGSRTLGARDVVVLDEAGMVGTRALARLVKAVQRSGTKLVLVGDPRQLPEIEAGGAFATLAVRLGDNELNQKRRQHQAWERAALDLLRAGHVVSALDAYESHGRIRLAATMAETRRDLVVRWLNARDAGEEVLMLAANRRDVSALNREARGILRSRATLGDDLVRASGRGFAAGEEVLCLRNAPRLEVINGTRGSVVDLAGGELVIDTAEGRRSLPLAYLEAGHLDYGYASTIHKAQGATYDRALVLATDSLTREAGYVAMSRARCGTELFVTAGVFEQGLGPDTPELEPLARTAARLAISRAKTLALTQMSDDEPGYDQPTDTIGQHRSFDHLEGDHERTAPGWEARTRFPDGPGFATLQGWRERARELEPPRYEFGLGQ